MDNPYASPPAVADSRSWFSGFPHWMRIGAAIASACYLAVMLSGLTWVAVHWGTIQANQTPGSVFLGDELGPRIDQEWRRLTDPPKWTPASSK